MRSRIRSSVSGRILKMALLAMGGVGSSLWFSIRLGGGTGRRTGLKIRSPARGVRVRPPSRALKKLHLQQRSDSAPICPQLGLRRRLDSKQSAVVLFRKHIQKTIGTLPDVANALP